MRKIVGLLAVAAALGVPAIVSALTIDFSTGTGGNLGTATFDSIPVHAHAYYWNGTVYVDTNTSLFRRQESDDAGFGVCSPGEQSSPACTANGDSGGGDKNELSNEDNSELIVLSLDPGWNWTDVFLSSLDCNDASSRQCTGANQEIVAEDGQLRFGNTLDLSVITPGTELLNFHGLPGSSTRQVTLTATGAESARILYFIPNGDLTTHDTNNDFLVRKADAAGDPTKTSTVPEPATAALLGLGLVALRLVRRSRRLA